jgi:DNA-binding response OmpR family regulator
LSGEKVLVVDDEPMISKFLNGFLAREGFEVYSITNGLEILHSFTKFRPDVILLDVMLPGKDGFEICSEIRKTSDVPIIFLSAKNETTDRILGLTLGADDYLTKPFDTAELLLRIKAVLRRSIDSSSKLQEQDILRISNLKIDIAARRVEKDNKEIKITQKEFDLLTLLAKNPNRVFTRDQLLETVWGTDFYDDTGIVTTLVKRLREKIEDNPANPTTIETVRGVGYRFGTKCR